MSTKLTAHRQTAAEICQLHEAIIGAARTTLENAIRIGELLTGIRGEMKHGEWLPWCKANLCFSDRTARNYLRVYDQRDRLKLENVSDLSSAYTLLLEPKPADDLFPDPDAPPDDSFPNPDAAHLLMGSRIASNGWQETAWIFPSTTPGFFFVSLVLTQGEDSGAWVEGLKRPIRADGVRLALKFLTWSNGGVENMTWESIPSEPRPKNYWLP